MCGLMNEWMNGWMDRRLEKWMNGQIDKYSCDTII